MSTHTPTEDHQVVSADGTRIAFRRIGSGPPLVIVHGGLGNARRWQLVADRLADRHELFVVDRRGRGGSDRGEPHSLAAEAADVRAVLAAAGPGAALLGHSYGGAAAIEAALAAAPGEIGRLVLYEPGDTGSIARERAERLVALSAEADPDALLAAGLGEMADAGLITREELDGTLALKGQPLWEELAEVGWTLPREIASVVEREPWTRERLARIAMPTLVIVGEQSLEPHRRACELLVELLPDARLARLAGQGHIAHRLDPDQLARVVGDFLAQG